MNAFSTTPGARRLPVFKMLKRAIELLWLHRWLQIRIGLPAFALLSVSVALGISRIVGVPPEKVPDMLQAIPAQYLISWMGICMVGTILLMMFSVTWRRFLLLDQAPQSLIFNKPFRRYLVMFVVAYFTIVFGSVILTNILYAAVQAAGVKDQSLLPGISAICLALSMGGMMLLVARYVLLFTAAIVDNHDMKLRDAAAYMKGNLLRYAAAWSLIAIGMNFIDNIAMLLVTLAGVDPAGIAGSIIAGVLTAATMLITCSLSASVAALTYDFLVRGGGPDTTHA